MSTFLTILIPLALGAVSLVLLLGVLNMAKGGSPEKSQKFMQLRVLFQFGAIIVVMLALFLASR
jgi:hypothetical protein